MFGHYIYTIPYHTIIYCTIPLYTIIYYTMPLYTIPYHYILLYTIPCHYILYHAIIYYTMSLYTIPCHYIILYHAIIYYTMPLYTIPCHYILYQENRSQRRLLPSSYTPCFPHATLWRDRMLGRKRWKLFYWMNFLEDCEGIITKIALNSCIIQKQVLIFAAIVTFYTSL